MGVKHLLSQLDHDPYWLNRYAEFLETVPGGPVRHHALPQALFPEYASLHQFPWNKVDLRPADHLIAHYYLYRALSGNIAARAAFVMMCGFRFSELVSQDYNEALVKEIAEEYEKARVGIRPPVKGWKRIYKSEQEFSMCSPAELQSYLDAGWKLGWKPTEETKLLWSSIRKGKPWTAARRAKGQPKGRKRAFRHKAPSRKIGTMPKEERDNISLRFANRKWMNNGAVIEFVPNDRIQQRLELGWKFGRKV